MDFTGPLPSQVSTPESPLPLSPPVTANLSADASQGTSRFLSHAMDLTGPLPSQVSTPESPLPLSLPMPTNLSSEASRGTSVVVLDYSTY